MSDMFIYQNNFQKPNIKFLV